MDRNLKSNAEKISTTVDELVQALENSENLVESLATANSKLEDKINDLEDKIDSLEEQVKYLKQFEP